MCFVLCVPCVSFAVPLSALPVMKGAGLRASNPYHTLTVNGLLGLFHPQCGSDYSIRVSSAIAMHGNDQEPSPQSR